MKIKLTQEQVNAIMLGLGTVKRLIVGLVYGCTAVFTLVGAAGLYLGVTLLTVLAAIGILVCLHALDMATRLP